jgi:hypothetical protein
MWAASGPIMAGAIYDATQSYTLALWIMLGLLTFATPLTLFLIRPWRVRMTALNRDSKDPVRNHSLLPQSLPSHQRLQL